MEPAGPAFRVTTRRDGTDRQTEHDLVVHGAGRVADIGHLDLDAAGIESNAERGVAVRPDLRSRSCPHAWAAGDAAASNGKPLTPVASLEGKTAASNMLEGTKSAPDYTGIPSAVFTIPELVRVGLTEDEARDEVAHLRVAFNDTSGWFTNRRLGEPCAAAKILVDEDTGLIVGAHLLGPGTAELANILGLAMRTGLTAETLRDMRSAYPTVGSDLGSLLADPPERERPATRAGPPSPGPCPARQSCDRLT